MPRKRRSSRPSTGRYRPYQDIGHVLREFLAAGPNAVQSNRTIAGYMFGAEDNQIQANHVRRARTMASKLVSIGLPLCPCDDNGTLLDAGAAALRARQGKKCLWRFDPCGRVISEALRESLGDVPLVTLAIGVLALELASIREGWEEATVLIEALRGVLPPAAMTEGERELRARRKAAALRRRVPEKNQPKKEKP